MSQFYKGIYCVCGRLCIVTVLPSKKFNKIKQRTKFKSQQCDIHGSKIYHIHTFLAVDGFSSDMWTHSLKCIELYTWSPIQIQPIVGRRKHRLDEVIFHILKSKQRVNYYVFGFFLYAQSLFIMFQSLYDVLTSLGSNNEKCQPSSLYLWFTMFSKTHLHHNCGFSLLPLILFT